MKYKILRYFNAAGCDKTQEVGEWHEPETHLIPLILRSLKPSKNIMTVYGTDYNTKDGTCVRDYIHVSDLASAHVICLHSLIQEGKSEIYNLSNERGYSVLEILTKVEEITGQKVNVKFGPRRHGDPDILVGDSSKIRRELGWVSNHSSLTNIINTAWEWNKKLILN